MAKDRVDGDNQPQGDELSMDELTAEDWAALDKANDEVGQRWSTSTDVDASDAEERADISADILGGLGVEDI